MDDQDNVVEMFDEEPLSRPTLEDLLEGRIKVLLSFNKGLKIFVVFLLLMFIVLNLVVIPRIVRGGEEDLLAREQAACEARVEEETSRTYSKVCSGERQCPTTPKPRSTSTN